MIWSTLADPGRLRPDIQNRVAFAQHQPGLPARGNRPKRVPDVASDQTDLI
jgi:hypothetical protein